MSKAKTLCEALDRQDQLDDLLRGFHMWKESKLGSGTWTDEDEAFLRWVEAGPS